MRRAGFTMIELIFVIVVLGILASVALPKFIGVSEQAYEAKVKALVGTLNRTIGPSLWSKSMASTDKGSIKNFDADDLKDFIDLSEVGDVTKKAGENEGDPYVDDIDLGKCEDYAKNTPIPTSATPIFSIKVGEKTFGVTCMDGSNTEAPKFGYVEID